VIAHVITHEPDYMWKCCKAGKGLTGSSYDALVRKSLLY
jgi:hypothetical protein